MAARITILFTVLVGLSGCASRPRVEAQPAAFYHAAGLTAPLAVPSVLAQCVPPEGWTAEPLKKSERHTHQVWLSPTRKTAYGVIHFKLPLPVGVDLVHWEFLQEMKKKEGEATEFSYAYDRTLPGARFVCEGGRYRMRVNLIVDGFEGWAIYAGTLREFAVVPEELALAERARERTIIGLPDRPASAKSE